ncbi:MAG: hypothetical protein LC789_10730 [Actinobacteria bacterium]|nr:hypothetical protein [Actinomycetota bacterium]MCA1722116.1 hypothetical protein [Actinomycetota bacterium]
MTQPEDNAMSQPDDTGVQEGYRAQDDGSAGVRGGDANERMDGGNENIGRGADGETAAREQLRVGLGERSEAAGEESGEPGLDG